MPNIYEPQFEPSEQPEGFRRKRARIGYELGSELIGASLFEVPPGQAAYPYHFHYADEEIIAVIRGRPTLRTPAGARQLDEGEVVRFPLGEEGAHQLINDSDETVSFLAISSSGRPDIVIYPDSNKVGLVERLPHGGGLGAYFRRDDAVDYFDGESPPAVERP